MARELTLTSIFDVSGLRQVAYQLTGKSYQVVLGQTSNACVDTLARIIYLPNTTAELMADRDIKTTLSLVRFLIDHECGHPSAGRGQEKADLASSHGQTAADCWNCVIDIHDEHELSQRFPGVKANLFDSEAAETITRHVEKKPVGSMTYQVTAGLYLKTHGINWHRITRNPLARKIVDKFSRMVDEAKTADTNRLRELAIELADAISDASEQIKQAMGRQQERERKQQQQQQKQQQKDSGEGEGEDADSCAGDEEQDDSGDSGDEGDEGGVETEESGEEDESDLSVEGEADDDDSGNEGEAQGDAGGAEGGEGDGGDAEGTPAQNGNDKSDARGEEEEGKSRSAESRESDADREMAQEVSIDSSQGSFDAADAVKEVTGQSADGYSSPESGNKIYVTDAILAKNSRLPKQVAASSAIESQRLGEAIASHDMVHVRPAQSGVVNKSRMIRANLGDPRVMLQRMLQSGKKTGVVVAVDMSGSMGDEKRIDRAKSEVALLVRTMANIPGVQCAIHGWTEGSWRRLGGSPLEGNGPLVIGVAICRVAKPTDPLHVKLDRIGRMQPFGGTPEKEAMFMAGYEAKLMDVHRRIVLFVTDGSFDDHAFRQSVEFWSKRGVETVAVFIDMGTVGANALRAKEARCGCPAVYTTADKCVIGGLARVLNEKGR